MRNYIGNCALLWKWVITMKKGLYIVKLTLLL